MCVLRSATRTDGPRAGEPAAPRRGPAVRCPCTQPTTQAPHSSHRTKLAPNNLPAVLFPPGGGQSFYLTYLLVRLGNDKVNQ